MAAAKNTAGRRVSRAAIALITTVASAASFLATPAAVAATTRLCGPHNHALTSWHRHGAQYMIRNPYWLGRGRTCIVAPRDGHPGFTVTRTPRRTRGYEKVTTYPDIFRGCIWNMCTPNTPIPIRTSRIARIVTSWHTVERATGMYNASYDLWFGKHRQTRGHADGAELMVWLNHRGGCCILARHSPVAVIDGHRFYVQHWRPHDPAFHVSWNYIQFRLVHPQWQVTNLDLRPFINYSRRHSWIYPAWWLESVEAGFEIWHGGVGLRTTAFNVHVVTR